MQKELSSLTKTLAGWIKDNKVLDIIIFGSFARGKAKANDIDLCILIEDSKEKDSLDISQSLSDFLKKQEKKFHISIMTISEFFSSTPLSKTLIFEGISVKNKKPFSFGFSQNSLFIYSLKKLSPSERVRFHYTLKGRYGSEGVLKKVEGNFIGKGAIIVPSEKEEELKETFENWKIDYSVKKILLG